MERRREGLPGCLVAVRANWELNLFCFLLCGSSFWCNFQSHGASATFFDNIRGITTCFNNHRIENLTIAVDSDAHFDISGSISFNIPYTRYLTATAEFSYTVTSGGTRA